MRNNAQSQIILTLKRKKKGTYSLRNVDLLLGADGDIAVLLHRLLHEVVVALKLPAKLLHIDLHILAQKGSARLVHSPMAS